MVWYLHRWLLKAQAKAEPTFEDHKRNLRSFVQFEARQKRVTNYPRSTRVTAQERRERMRVRNNQLLKPSELDQLDNEFDQLDLNGDGLITRYKLYR